MNLLKPAPSTSAQSYFKRRLPLYLILEAVAFLGAYLSINNIVPSFTELFGSTTGAYALAICIEACILFCVAQGIKEIIVKKELDALLFISFLVFVCFKIYLCVYSVETRARVEKQANASAVLATISQTTAPTEKVSFKTERDQRKAMQANAKGLEASAKIAEIAAKEREAKDATSTDKEENNKFLFLLFDCLLLLCKGAAAYIKGRTEKENSTGQDQPTPPTVAQPSHPTPPAPTTPPTSTKPTTPTAPAPSTPAPPTHTPIKPLHPIAPHPAPPVNVSENEDEELTAEEIKVLPTAKIKARFVSSRARVKKNMVGAAEKMEIYQQELSARGVDIPQERPSRTA